MPPARIIPLSDGLGYTCRATTQCRSPPPIQSSEASASPDQQPDPVEPAEPGQERLEVVAVEQGDPEAHQGGEDRELEAAEEKLGGEETGHVRAKAKAGGEAGKGRKDGSDSRSAKGRRPPTIAVLSTVLLPLPNMSRTPILPR